MSRLRVPARLTVATWLGVPARLTVAAWLRAITSRLLAVVAGLAADCRLIAENPRLPLVRRLIRRTHRVPLTGLARDTAARLN
ncbi:MAG TPA: hypothetical protein VF940_23350 [Streptosporangiaceae bacterium]